MPRYIVIFVLMMLGISSAFAQEILPSKWVSPNYSDHPLVGKMVNADGKQVPTRLMLFRATNTRYILLGENHDNPDHHTIQANFIRAMARGERRPTIVLEMVTRRYNEQLNTFDLTSDPKLDAFAKSLDWEKRGWNSWDIYRPIGLAAAQNNLRMAGGNLERKTTRAISKSGLGSLTEAERKSFALDTDLPTSLAESLLEELKLSHCGMMSEKALPAMVNVQRSVDGSLADAMISTGKQYGALLIAGNGHVRKDRGVPFALKTLLPGSNIITLRGNAQNQNAPLKVRVPNSHNLSVGLIEVDPERQLAAEYGLRNKAGAALYDYVIFTPKFDISDPCEAMREAFKKTKKDKR